MSVSQLPSWSAGKWPENVGIVALDVYFPSQCVDQTALEAFDGASSGKYTIGLGQLKMGFCSDVEDINSICLTAVQSLMDKTGVSYNDIGRLEVGTETILDKSKSTKTVLMQLFAASGNTSVEGLDTTNACYGGTQALFNAVSWLESSAWDGRFALVVAADIAVYASGNARPTGGAGAVTMLIGPNAALVMERGLRGVHMEHVYDFYKPNLQSEYAVVNGKLSIQCYTTALDKCYQRYAEKAGTPDKPFTIRDGDYFLFHSPFTKLVIKSLGRLKLNDFLRDPAPDMSGPYAGLESLVGRTLESTVGDRDVEKLIVKNSTPECQEKTEPSLTLGREVGNMYTASLYGGLASLLANVDSSNLTGKRVVLFSYGSGLASAMYSLRVTSDPKQVTRLVSTVTDIPQRLSARTIVEPETFEKAMKLREETHHLAPYTPVLETSSLFPGTYYLTAVDDSHKRVYKRVASSNGVCTDSLKSPIAEIAGLTNGVA